MGQDGMEIQNLYHMRRMHFHMERKFGQIGWGHDGWKFFPTPKLMSTTSFRVEIFLQSGE